MVDLGRRWFGFGIAIILFGLSGFLLSMKETGVLLQAPVLRVSTTKDPESRSPSSMGSHFEAPPIGEAPHVVYGDLHYRRICARVGQATELCLTIRFPFPVPLQDSNYTYPRPFTNDWYDLDRDRGLPILDGEDLTACRTNETFSIDDTVKSCLDRHSTAETGAAIFTRSIHGTTQLFGTGTPEQSTRIQDFYGNGVVVFAGASPTPGIYKCMLDLFGVCHDAGVVRRGRGSSVCTPERRQRRLLDYGMEYLENQDDLYVGVSDQYIAPKNWQVDPNVSLVEWLGLRRPANWTTLRPLTILVDYPIAHCQTQTLMMGEWNRTVSIAEEFPVVILNVTSENGRMELREAGFELERLIVFDGLPQSFPTETGGYDAALRGSPTENEFLENGGYPGWYSELGSQCRGPLPRSSKLRTINEIARSSFEELGFDMAWYGRIWEFANQFWWQTNRYDRNGLDCTHSHAKHGGYYCVHRYFLQAMIDDYYETRAL